MGIAPKKTKPVAVPASADGPGAIPTSWDNPTTEGPSNKYPLGSDGPKEEYDLDPALDANQFPRQGGSDSYTGIPGDGKVPG